jgi:hypothetical protein
MKTSLKKIITTIALIPTTLSFILNPLTYDVHAYQAVARLTDYFGTSFPANLDAAWEIKPIGNRFINYALYKVAALAAPFGSVEYEMVIKTICLALVLIVAWYFARHYNNPPYLSLLTALAFITPLNPIQLQPEWFAVLFALLAIALMLSDKWYLQAAAGMVITGIFLLKGITILLIIPILWAVWLEKGSDWFRRATIAGEASVISLLAVIGSGFFPNLIPDMLMSSRLAHVGMWSPAQVLANLIFGSISSMVVLYVPIITVGLAALGVACWQRLKAGSFSHMAIMLAAWASGIFIVMIQSEEYFAYQYFVLALPALITITMLKDKAIRYAIIGILILSILFASHWSPGAAQGESAYPGIEAASAAGAMAALPDIGSQPAILYLDVGDAPYYFQVNSSCRYICPLPFQRNSEYWNITDMRQYREERDCILGYRGKYIISAVPDAGRWMVQNTSDSREVDRDYFLAWNQSWSIYQRKAGA